MIHRRFEIPDAHTTAVELATTVFIIGVLLRGGAQQYAYRLLYGEFPECKPALDEVLQTDFAFESEIDPADTPVFRLAPAVLALVGPSLFAFPGWTLTGHSAPAMVGVAWLLGNWAFAIVWDPLVWATEAIRR